MTQTFDPFDPDRWPGGCDAFELALAMRTRSALAADAIPVLEAHLVECESCRAQAAGMAAVDAALAAHDRAAVPPSWDRVSDRLHASVRRYRRRTPWVFVLAGAGAIAAWAILAALFDPGPMHIGLMAGTFAGYLALMVVTYLVHLRRGQRLLEHVDVVAAYRGELERRLRIALTTRWVWVIVVVGELYEGKTAFEAMRAGHVHAPLSLAMNALVLGLALGGFVLTFFTARTARRELAGLR